MRCAFPSQGGGKQWKWNAFIRYTGLCVCMGCDVRVYVRAHVFIFVFYIFICAKNVFTAVKWALSELLLTFWKFNEMVFYMLFAVLRWVEQIMRHQHKAYTHTAKHIWNISFWVRQQPVIGSIKFRVINSVNKYTK